MEHQARCKRNGFFLFLLVVVDKLGFNAHFVRTNQGDKKFCGAFLKATEGTGREALYSAFLLIAFLCAYFVKEKRLKTFSIKGLLTLFLLRKETQKKKLCKKKKAIFVELRAPHRATVRGAPPLKRWTKQSRKVSANIPDKSKFEKIFKKLLTILVGGGV